MESNGTTPASQDGGDQVILDGRRKLVVMEAVWEIAELAQHIIDQSGMEDLLFRGLAARIKELNSAVMEGVGDDFTKTDDLRHKLYRNHMEREGVIHH